MGTRSRSPDLPVPQGCRVRGTSVCCPAEGPAHSLLHGATVLGVGMAGHTLLWAWLKVQDAGPEPPWGPCRQLPVSSMLYLSDCRDNQRINDLCFFHVVVCSKRGTVSGLPQTPSLVAATLGSVQWHMAYGNAFAASGRITQVPWAVTTEGHLGPQCAYLLWELGGPGTAPSMAALQPESFKRPDWC